MRIPTNWHTQIEYSANGDEATIRHTEQLDPVLKYVKDIRDNSDRGFFKDRSAQYLGTVPMSIIHKYKLKTPEDMVKWLNSEEGQAFRIPQGRSGSPNIIIK